MSAFVAFDDVWLAYNDELLAAGQFAVEAITLRAEPGEFIAIVGPSGCGKSTFMKLATGLRTPSKGTVMVDGRPVGGPLKITGMAFQSSSLLPWRTTLDNVLLPLEIVEPHRSNFRSQRAAYAEKARKLLQSVGLGGYEDKFPWQLSGGMQQRASICRALVHDPAVLLMDEPFGALDAMTRERMNLELQRIWAETRKTVLFITHSIPEAVFLADRVLVMTERPGAIAAIYEVPLPRPRSLAVMGDPTFTALAQTIRGHFYSQGTLDT
jgi:NitT/TauT family transport system ATP-binding protein